MLEQIHHRGSPETEQRVEVRTMKGFAYLTLDPSPRLRKMREDQQRAAKTPAQIVGEAWLSVGEAIRGSLESIQSRSTSPR